MTRRIRLIKRSEAGITTPGIAVAVLIVVLAVLLGVAVHPLLFLVALLAIFALIL